MPIENATSSQNKQVRDRALQGCQWSCYPLCMFYVSTARHVGLYTSNCLLRHLDIALCAALQATRALEGPACSQDVMRGDHGCCNRTHISEVVCRGMP